MSRLVHRRKKRRRSGPEASSPAQTVPAASEWKDVGDPVRVDVRVNALGIYGGAVRTHRDSDSVDHGTADGDRGAPWSGVTREQRDPDRIVEAVAGEDRD